MEVNTTNTLRYGVGSCSKTKATLAECVSCSQHPPDGSTHGWIWKRVSQHLCNVKLGAKGGIAVGSNGVVHSVGAGVSHVCSVKCGTVSGHFKCDMVCPTPLPGLSGFGSFGATGDTTTVGTGFQLCTTPYYTIPKIAFFGAGALALFSMVGQHSPMKKTLFDVAVYGGLALFGASLVNCINLQ